MMRALFRTSLALVISASVAPSKAAPPAAKQQGQGSATQAPGAGEVLTAKSISGLPGYVRSPYTNPPQLVNVQGAAPGSTVICPYTQKPFIVPGDIEAPKEPTASVRPTVKEVASAPPSGKSVKDAAVVTPLADSAWKVSVGAQWRQIGEVNWNTGSLASSWSLPWLAGRGSNSSGASIPSGAGNHQYDDGFVNVDSSGPGSGSTWFWGYNSNSQVQGNDLVFTADTSFSTFTRSASSSLRHSSWSDDLEGFGAFAKIESPELLRVGDVAVSLDFGYSWAQDESSHVTKGVFQATQATRLVTGGGLLTDRYDVTGLLLPLAPFAGTFGGPGPIIPNAPYSRTLAGGGAESAVSSTALFSSDVRETFEVNLHTLSFGPRFSIECCPEVRFGLGLGLALNIADWDADYQETLSVSRNGGSERVLRRWNASESGTEVLPGFYLEAICQIALTERLSAYVAGRYDWSDDMSEQVGPSRVSFEPGGWSVMLGLTLSL